ncbi:MAG: hypothetical protein LBT33_06325, partial [Spirochaetia bacterium]|nr:hypothetical protein [Spirochaetia bacterium]
MRNLVIASRLGAAKQSSHCEGASYLSPSPHSFFFARVACVVSWSVPSVVSSSAWPVVFFRARGWSQFCFAKLLLAHAAWIEAEILLAQPKDCSGKPGLR